MVDSDFWNDLGKQFRSVKNCKHVCVNWADVPGADLETWEFGAVGTVLLSARLEFEALARRAGAKINPESDDPFAAWLSRLKREGRKDLVKVGATYPWGDMTKGQIQDVCTVSADYCKILEPRALRSEQQVNRRNLLEISKTAGGAQERSSQEAPNEPRKHMVEHTALDRGSERRAAVDGFLVRVKQETEQRALKTHIWKAAGHTTPRQFQYWQAGEDRPAKKARGATDQDDQNFKRILAMEPKEFLALLRKKQLI